MVPTVDTARNQFIITTLVGNNKHKQIQKQNNGNS